MMEKYKLIICDKCKRPQTGYGEKFLKCKDCDKSNSFSVAGHRRNWIISDNNPNVIAERAKELKAICYAVSSGGSVSLLSDFFNKYK